MAKFIQTNIGSDEKTQEYIDLDKITCIRTFCNRVWVVGNDVPYVLTDESFRLVKKYINENSYTHNKIL